MILALAILAGAVLAALIVGALTCRLQHERNDCVARTVFRVFAVECGFARYDPYKFENVTGPHDGGLPKWKRRPSLLARPASGAALGIAWSFWIYTRRHAWGRGMVKDWAQPSYLQFMVAEMITGSELGYFEVRPRRRYDHDQSVRVGVINTGAVPAVGFVTLAGTAETGNLGMRVEATRPFDVRPGGSLFDIPFGDGFEGADFVLEKVKFITEPSGEFRVGRLHGRPEWEPVLWRK
jgi:hypothetical protein